MFALESEFAQFHLSALDAEMTLCLSLKNQLQPKFSFPQFFSLQQRQALTSHLIHALKAVFFSSPTYSQDTTQNSLPLHGFPQLGRSHLAQYSSSSHGLEQQSSNTTPLLPDSSHFTDPCHSTPLSHSTAVKN